MNHLENVMNNSCVSQGRVGSKPYLKIIEQPARNNIRFRYECEGRSAGSIHGVNSTDAQKTFPSVKIIGFTGDASIIVSCVSKETPYR